MSRLSASGDKDIDDGILEALIGYARELDASPYALGHVLIAANAALCFARAGVPLADPIFAKVLVALDGLPIYGDEDIHWEIVRTFTFAHLNYHCQNLERGLATIRASLDSNKWPLFDDRTWGLFAASTICELPEQFSMHHREVAIQWLRHVQNNLRKERDFYLLSFALVDEFSLSGSSDAAKFDDCVCYAKSLLDAAKQDYHYTESSVVWDRLVRAADIIALSVKVEPSGRWVEAIAQAVPVLYDHRNIRDLRKRAQIIRALVEIRGLTCTELSSVNSMRGQLSDGEVRRADSIARRIQYWHPLMEHDVYSFILQSPNAVIRTGLLDLLEQVKVFSTEALELGLLALLDSALLKPPAAVLVSLGDPTGSTGLMCYGMRHLSTHLQYVSIEGNSIAELPDYVDTLVLIDDCALSGTQALGIWGELFEKPRDAGTFKHIRAPLSAESKARLKALKVFHLFAVSSSFAAHRLQAYLSDKAKNVSIKWRYDEPYVSELAANKYFERTLLDENNDLRDPEIVPYNSAFRSGAPNWTSNQTMIETKQFLSEVGYEILADMGFSEKRRRQSSLGYSNAQKLIVFYHNVPKSTIAALWRRGRYGSNWWKPIFPERDRNPGSS
jgi:hypothetical protein